MSRVLRVNIMLFEDEIDEFLLALGVGQKLMNCNKRDYVRGIMQQCKEEYNE